MNIPGVNIKNKYMLSNVNLFVYFFEPVPICDKDCGITQSILDTNSESDLCHLYSPICFILGFSLYELGGQIFLPGHFEDKIGDF